MCKSCNDKSTVKMQTTALFPSIPAAEIPDLPESTPIECANCGTKVDEDDAVQHDGDTYCNECVSSCDRCNNTAFPDDLHDARHSYRRNSGTDISCESCCWKCADCDTYYRDGLEEYRNSNDERICEECTNNYSSCESCNCTIHCDDSRYDQDNERTLCSSCYDEEVGSEAQLVKPYSYKPMAHFLRAKGENNSRVRYFGWELEVENKRGESDDNIRSSGIADDDTLYCKSDGSLSDGFEIVSHPGTFDYWKERPLPFLAKLARNGCRSYDTTTCGMHIHVSRNTLSKLDQFKLLAFFRLNADLVFKLSRRKHIDAMNGYAKVVKDGNGRLVEKLHHAAGNDRYEAINFQNSKTVEFRIFRGTLSEVGFRRNLALVAALCEFVRHTSIRKLWSDSFVRWLKSDGWTVIGTKDAKSLVAWIRSATSPAIPCEV